ncbi:MAG: DNA alkylation repair protein [Prevotella sp.]|jgi:hypothetical protein|nr:DNA alkylation repair protein [Prevotella sp.]
MNTELSSKVKDIKQSFRQMMDGAVAQSMRDKGLNYHLNWGATLPRLREMAEELKSVFNVQCSSFNVYDLSIALWKENIRECKILATMLMPANQMAPEVCDIWMEQIPSQEIAEQVAFNVWQYLPYAPEKAYQWIASDKEYDQLCGFHVLSRLFMNGQEPNERGINEFIDQALAALQGPFISVRKSAMQSIIRFSELGLVYERLAKSALKSVNLELF